MTNDATNAIAAAPTTRSPNAGVGIGPLVPTAALAGACCWDSTGLSLLCGDRISYSFGRPDDRDSMIADVDRPQGSCWSRPTAAGRLAATPASARAIKARRIGTASGTDAAQRQHRSAVIALIPGERPI